VASIDEQAVELRVYIRDAANIFPLAEAMFLRRIIFGLAPQTWFRKEIFRVLLEMFL
jgi:hypothetical protein